MAPNSNTPSLLKSISPVPFKSRTPDVDPKWKQFSSAVDRALDTWESVQEWADYISFLGKLHRALKQASGQGFSNVPSTSLVAFRLAKCLDPSLPSGVHQKTLEVYNSVFEILNGQELHNQIHLWLPGLLPLMSYASINVKPPLIDLFERHILPLPSLRSILKPLLLSFLPGIDDESSESFDEVFRLIADIKLKVNDDSHFWQCLFLVMISSRDRRPGALVWANKRFPSFDRVSHGVAAGIDDLVGDIPAAYQSLSYDAQMAATPETGLLIRAFAKGLQDEHSLVQRGFLELLVKNLQLQSPVLQVLASKEDLQLLLVSACSTVLRRDMSLNRRLWIWLLGPEPMNNESYHYSRAEYFSKFALDGLVNGLLEMINNDNLIVPADKTKAYKICLSILDRWEIGSSVVPRVLLPIIKSVQRYDRIKRSDSDYDEVIRSAGALFDGVEAINIWSDVLKLITEGGEDNLTLVLFILDVFNVRDEEMIVNHLPLILLALLHEERERSVLWYKLCFSVLDLIPERAFLPIDHAEYDDNDAILDKIKRYYELNISDDDNNNNLPFTPATLSLLLLNQLACLTIQSFENIHSNQANVGSLSTLLANLLNKIPHQQKWRNDKLVTTLATLQGPLTYTSLSGIIVLFITIYDSFGNDEIDDFIFSICRFLFIELSITSNNNQVEIIQSIWSVQEKLDDKRIESALATYFTDNEKNALVKITVFSTLYQHSINRTNCEVILERCLFLILDLATSSADSITLIQHWLECVIKGTNTKRFLEFIINPLLQQSDDIELTIYHLNILITVIRIKPELQVHFKEELNNKRISQVIMDIIENIIYSRSKSINDKETQKSLNNCLDLLESIDQPKQETELFELSMLLLNILGFYYETKELTSLPQVRILSLLSQTLLRLDEIAPIWKQIYSNELFNETDKSDGTTRKSLPKTLFQCLINGISISNNEYVVRAWCKFLVDILPLFGQGIIQVIIPLVECLCKAISSIFEEKRLSLVEVDGEKMNKPVDTATFYPYMDALQDLLVSAHEKLDSQDRTSTAKPANDPSFFGNVISGVFAVESPMSRPAAANDRLTVLLCFQDAVRTSYNVWRWVEHVCKPSQNPSDSIVFILSPLKARTRKLLGTLYTLETLEMLECYIELSRTCGGDIFKVLHVLDGSRPKLTIPFIFNALISRINPASLEAGEKSTLTTDLDDNEISEFLINYVNSLENDSIEEVWYECMGFVREIYNNQSLYRHVLANILQFISTMAEKVDAVKFGEQRKVRKDLSDLFLKLLHYGLTRPSLGTVEVSSSNNSINEKEKEKLDDGSPILPSLSSSSLPLSTTTNTVTNTPTNTATNTITNAVTNTATNNTPTLKQEELVKAIEKISPSLKIIINDQDKTLTAITSIITNLITPSLRQKSYNNIPNYLTSLLTTITHLPNSLKSWKGVVGDAFLDPRFLTITQSQASQWKPIISKWGKYDKERIKDYVARISSYGTNSNVLFGWSDQESAIQSQNLDRLAYLFICGTGDGFTIRFKDLIDKLELLCVGRNIQHVLLCLRAIILSVDSTHLAPVWTFLYTQLSNTFRGFLNQEKGIDLPTLVAACKLLDTTIILNPEDFQSYEWLFICDSMDAIFRNEDRDPSGIIDRISSSKMLPPAQTKFDINFTNGIIPLLYNKPINSLTDLRPFFDQFSMFAYEGLYSLATPDITRCKQEVIQEIFKK